LFAGFKVNPKSSWEDHLSFSEVGCDGSDHEVAPKEKLVFDMAKSWVFWKIANQRATDRCAFPSILAEGTEEIGDYTRAELEQFLNDPFELPPSLLEFTRQIFSDIHLPPRREG
jgi:hypothetical protein